MCPPLRSEEHISIFSAPLLLGLLGSNGLVGGNGYHFINVVDGASARQVVYGASDTLEDRTNRGSMTQALHKFIADVAHFKARHYEYISMSGHRTARGFALTHSGHERSISLKFSVNEQRRIKLFGQAESLYHFVYIFVLG